MRDQKPLRIARTAPRAWQLLFHGNPTSVATETGSRFIFGSRVELTEALRLRGLFVLPDGEVTDPRGA